MLTCLSANWPYPEACEVWEHIQPGMFRDEDFSDLLFRDFVLVSRQAAQGTLSSIRTGTFQGAILSRGTAEGDDVTMLDATVSDSIAYTLLVGTMNADMIADVWDEVRFKSSTFFAGC